MKKRIIACLMAAVLVLSLLSVNAFAQTDVDLGHEDGRLLIQEPGSYVLTGKLMGCVYVDPHEGEVELVLDGVDIDGGNGGGIIAVSGDRLSITLPEGSVNRVVDGGTDTLYGAAIFSRVDLNFGGSGALYVTGKRQDAIRADGANLSFNGGSYAIKAPGYGIGADAMTMNDGHFSIQAQANFDPATRLTMNGGVIEEVSPAGVVAPVYSAVDYPAYTNTDAVTVPNIFETAANWFTDLVTPQPAVNDNGFNGQQPPEMSGNTFNGQQPPEMNGSSFDGQQPPEMSGTDFSGQQPPEMNGSSFNGQQPPEMNGTGFNGQQPGGMQQTWDTASTAGEVVSGTVTNSAASLTADYDNATYISVTDDDSQVKISSSGTYVVSGESSDGNITVKKGTTGVVLVLENLNLTSTTGATVSINKEAEVKVIISGNVVLTDNENPDDENSEDADIADAFDGAAFKAKANSNVYVTGDGTLTINGNAKNGIKAGDDSSLIFDGVTVNINAVNDGINGNYDVTLLSGNFTIAAGDDAIHADHILTIGDPGSGEGPTVRVTQSNEGMEGTVVNIYGGDLSIVSADDAINAANGDGLYEDVLDYSFNMMGGKLSINSQGDGIDSNGNINLIGGNAEIHSATQGGEAGMDYDGQLYISEDFSLNNQSGTAGPDGMGGSPAQMGGAPGEMGSQSFGGQQSPEMGGGFSGQQSGGFGGGPAMGGGFGGAGMRG